MARPVADLCMFCTDEGPCAKHAPKVKAKPSTQRRLPVLNRKCSTCGHIQDRHGGDKDCMECDCMGFSAPIAQSNTRSIRSSSSSSREKADVTAAMKAAAQVRHQGSTIKEDHDAQDETTAILGDPEFTSAIQALEPLMHPTERKRFARVLDAKPDHRSRAAAWKQRVLR